MRPKIRGDRTRISEPGLRIQHTVAENFIMPTGCWFTRKLSSELCAALTELPSCRVDEPVSYTHLRKEDIWRPEFSVIPKLMTYPNGISVSLLNALRIDFASFGLISASTSLSDVYKRQDFIWAKISKANKSDFSGNMRYYRIIR